MEINREQRQHGDVILNFKIFARNSGGDICETGIDDTGGQRLVNLTAGHSGRRGAHCHESSIRHRPKTTNFHTIKIGGRNQS